MLKHLLQRDIAEGTLPFDFRKIAPKELFSRCFTYVKEKFLNNMCLKKENVNITLNDHIFLSRIY